MSVSMTSSANGESVSLHPVLRVEWANSKLVMDWWVEEVTLVKEEMRRVLAYFQWKVNWWLTEDHMYVDSTSTREQGIAAYRKKQAAILSNLAISFKRMWLPYVEESILLER